MLHKRINIKLFLLSSFLFLSFFAHSEPTIAEGKTLFKNNCASCHAGNMKVDLTGPALGGVQDRWESEENLYAWIRNSQKFLGTGDAYANKLFKDWNGSVMTAFPNLTDDQVAGILMYINEQYTKVDGPKDGPKDPKGPQESNNTVYYFLLGVLALLSLFLARFVSRMNALADEKEGKVLGRQPTVVEQLLSRKVIGFVLFALVLIGGYTTVNNAISLGRQTGYAPTQPIKFSHVTHAGVQKIDCQYCHDGARRSKHSVIPATNTCMNCHTAVKVGSQYGTAELTKIYASAGWNPIKGIYFEDDVSKADKMKVFEAWVKDNFVKENKEATEKTIAKEVASQLEGIDGHVGMPIEWEKIHNLPDHVYFNHAQHVSVGKVECQTCHGPVEEMEVVQQYSPLSMGWCINCHRQTEVQFADNPYYDSYEQYHKELKDVSSGRTGVTVEEIGGLECQKCHY